MNKYLISVDIEGISGVVNRSFATADGSNYELARRYMLCDVNAVVQGILNVDPQALIVVRDAHETATNLDLERLHHKANLLQGWGATMNMLEGLDGTYSGVFFVGYHAGGDNNEAVLGHTMFSLVRYIKINDKAVNEAGINAAYASHFNVPVVFISGDDHAVNEGKKQLDASVIGVMVKKSYARDCVLCLPLDETHAALEEGAEHATRNILEKKCSLLKPTCPIELEIGFYNLGFGISVFQKLYEVLNFDSAYEFDVKSFTVKYKSESALEMYKRLNLLMQLAYSIKSSG